MMSDEAMTKEQKDQAAEETSGGKAEQPAGREEGCSEKKGEKKTAAKKHDSKKETPEIEADTKARAEADARAEEKKADAEALAKEKDRYVRLMAEFQNYKKRVAGEKSDIHAYANEKIITELVEVLDNFERALQHDPADDSEAYAKGMNMIFEQMKGVLVKAGLEEVEALGQDFDPNMHNAVMTEETEEYESGKVSWVLQKGYTLNKKVIRPAMVTVNK